MMTENASLRTLRLAYPKGARVEIKYGGESILGTVDGVSLDLMAASGYRLWFRPDGRPSGVLLNVRFGGCVIRLVGDSLSA